MNVKVKEVRILTEEDFGAFVQVFTHFRCNGKHVLCLEAGYQEPDEETWYELDGEPTTFPTKDETDVLVNCYEDQSRDLPDFVGVTGRKLDKRPEGIEPL